MGEVDTMDEIRRAVDLRSRLFEACFAAGDARGLVEAYFVEDSLEPMASPPGGPPVRGREALCQMFAQQILAVSAIRLQTLQLDASAGLGFEFGRAFLTPRVGAELSGRYAVQWRAVGATWRAKIDVFAEGWTD